MKSGWESTNVGSVLQLEYGKPLPDEDRSETGRYPVYGANGEKARSNRFYYDKPTIIVGRKGSAGEIALTHEKFWPLDVTYYTTFNESRYSLKFLYYLLSTLNLPSMARGVKPGINRNDVYALNISVPSLEEQHRIVAILDEAFAGIAAAKANVEANLQNARAVFDSHLQSVFAQRDNGWKRVCIDAVCESIMDCVNKTAPKVDGETPFKMIRTTNVRNGRVNLDSVNYVTEDVFRIWTRRQIPQLGDVLLTREAPMGEVGMLVSDDKVFLGQRIVSYRADSTKLDNHFLLYALQSGDLQGQIHALASGSTVQHMRVPDSKKLMLPLPDLAEQATTVATLDALRAETQRLQSLYRHKLEALDELKQSLLQRAFAGEL